MSESGSPPVITQKTTPPPGVLPRNAQTWAITGVALLMVVVILFSGRTPPKDRSTPTSPTVSSVIDPNATRILEYRASIEEQARKLQVEQARLLASKQALASEVSPAGAYPSPRQSGRSTWVQQGGPGYEPMSPEDGWLRSERTRREYESLFASNVALSYRAEGTGDGRQAQPAHSTSLTPPPASTDTGSLIPASTRPPRTRLTGADMDTGRSIPTSESLRNATDSYPANAAQGNMYRLFEGTVIESVLTNRLDGTFSGPVNCLVTTNVYSHNGLHLLIPQGSRALGEVRRVDNFGQERLAVVFHRLVMPDGYSLRLDQFRGLNQIGETGLRDQVNHHYAQIFGVSLAIGAIAGLSQANSNYGAEASAADAYRQGVATSLSQTSLHILDRYLNVLPTITIREGHRIKIMLADDLVLPAYDAHHMPEEL